MAKSPEALEKEAEKEVYEAERDKREAEGSTELFFWRFSLKSA